MPEALLTVEDVAKMLGVTPNWIHRHASGRGVLLPSLKVGKYRRFRASDVEGFVEHCAALASDAAAARNRTRRVA